MIYCYKNDSAAPSPLPFAPLRSGKGGRLGQVRLVAARQVLRCFKLLQRAFKSLRMAFKSFFIDAQQFFMAVKLFFMDVKSFFMDAQPSFMDVKSLFKDVKPRSMAGTQQSARLLRASVKSPSRRADEGS